MVWDGAMCDPVFYGGADWLLVQPTFSEAIAFARGQQTIATFQTTAEPLDFSYQSSLRAFFGYRLPDTELQFTYWHLTGDVRVDGTAGGPGQFLVDPFGNLVGSVTIIDPSDNRFGSVITGGDLIQTLAEVEANVFDIDLRRSLLDTTCWSAGVTAGLRGAKVDQFYSSTITDTAGNFVSGGSFFAEFTGAGPRVGLDLEYLPPQFALALFANSDISLLLGDYDVGFSANPVPAFLAGQSASSVRVVPAIDIEVGVRWQLLPYLTLHGGWLFQSWFDLGTSGGTFAGLYAGADDANIMAFDGLFLRGEYAF